MSFIPKKIFIDDRVKNAQFAKEITARFPSVPTILIEDTNSFIKARFKEENCVAKGKEVLFLTENKGRFLKKCPGTRNYVCCGYQILHPASQCNFDCSYCILQSYFNNPMITMFTNIEEMLSELDQAIDSDPKRKWRIGTGEYTDSLAFDDMCQFSKIIIPYFLEKKNAILELKTKSAKIDNLLDFTPKGNIISAWSMNAKSINENEETDAASIDTRLECAKKCQEQGYKLAFHFDPIFYFDGWEKEYEETVNKIFDKVSDKEIVWISMGCFRFIPSLKNIIQERFPKTRFIYNEFILGKDDKMRYPKTVRINIYKKMLDFIRKRSKNVFVYLCMESPEVWERSFGYTPSKFGSLKNALDAQVFSDIKLTP